MAENETQIKYKAVVIGCSAGGLKCLDTILSSLHKDFELPIFIVQHLHKSDEGSFSLHISEITNLKVIEPCDKEKIQFGHLYTAPANYHMLVEKNETISLSVDEQVNWSRPSIDVLFESASLTWGTGVIAIILSGANSDGTKGMIAINEAGGLTIAQDPLEAEFPIMPKSAIDSGSIKEVLSLKNIAKKLSELGIRQ